MSKRTVNAKVTRLTRENILKEFGTKSAAIRHLDSLGWSRTEIADFLGLRYQHVRTVLITPLTSEDSGNVRTLPRRR